MTVREEGVLLRIFIGESDTWRGTPLHEAIVARARELHLAGATVFRGALGYGASSRLHTARILRLSEDLPVVVEIVDGRDKIDELLPHLEAMLEGGMATLEPVQIVRYGPGPAAQGG